VAAGATIGALIGLVLVVTLLWRLTRNEKQEKGLTQTIETEEVLTLAEPMDEYVTQIGLSDGDGDQEVND
jgi:hypothetical protein